MYSQCLYTDNTAFYFISNGYPPVQYSKYLGKVIASIV